MLVVIGMRLLMGQLITIGGGQITVRELTLDKNGLFHVKATLTAGPCNVDGEPVAFSYTLQVKNGRLAINTTYR